MLANTDPDPSRRKKNSDLSGCKQQPQYQEEEEVKKESKENNRVSIYTRKNFLKKCYKKKKSSLASFKGDG